MTLLMRGFAILFLCHLGVLGCGDEHHHHHGAGDVADGGNDNNGLPMDMGTPNGICGDGTLDAGEECDDGNTDDGDGCSASCVTELIAADCAELLANEPGLLDGDYMIDPDGEGGAAPFEVYCDMTTDGGGWTLLTHTYLDALQTGDRRYLYRCAGQCEGAAPLTPEQNNGWYRTPVTNGVWAWDAYISLPGTYSYGAASPTETGSFDCAVDSEPGLSGFGCASTPGGGGQKVVPVEPIAPDDGEVRLCQDSPGIFGTWDPGPNNACVNRVRVFERRAQ